MKQITIGEKMHSLTILKELPQVVVRSSNGTKRKCRRVLCICDCGKEEVTLLEYLSAGRKLMCKACLKNRVKDNKLNEQHEKITEMLKQGINQEKIAETCGCSLASVQYVKKKVFGAGILYVKKDLVKNRVYEKKELSKRPFGDEYKRIPQKVSEKKVIEPIKEGYFDYKTAGSFI